MKVYYLYRYSDSHLDKRIWCCSAIVNCKTYKEHYNLIKAWNQHEPTFNYMAIPISCIKKIYSLQEIALMNNNSAISWKLPWPEEV